MKHFLPIFFISGLILSCNSKVAKDDELDHLMSFLVGEFSNEEQAKNDDGFAFLRLINIPIWKNKPGHWIYTELYDANKDNYVYTQRILQYERVDSSTFKSTSYQILNAKDYKQGWKDISVFDKLTIDSLKIRNGCNIFFEKNTSTIYTGKTKKKSCSSTIDSIEYITSNFVISRNKISIWNKGYNDEGKQVWGKINGPYKYKKATN